MGAGSPSKKEAFRCKERLDNLHFSDGVEVHPPDCRKVSEVENRLSEVDPDMLSPRDAMDLTYELRGMPKERYEWLMSDDRNRRPSSTHCAIGR